MRIARIREYYNYHIPIPQTNNLGIQHEPRAIYEVKKIKDGVVDEDVPIKGSKFANELLASIESTIESCACSHCMVDVFVVDIDVATQMGSVIAANLTCVSTEATKMR